MAVQNNLFPDTPAEPAPPPRPDETAVSPLWLQRMSLFVRVIFCVYLGVIITILPWWTNVWDHNQLFTAHPHLWAVLKLGPTRGVISGLGLLDIWVGISEAIHYRDTRRTPENHAS